jgi:hypothetical protein
MVSLPSTGAPVSVGRLGGGDNGADEAIDRAAVIDRVGAASAAKLCLPEAAGHAAQRQKHQGSSGKKAPGQLLLLEAACAGFLRFAAAPAGTQQPGALVARR